MRRLLTWFRAHRIITWSLRVVVLLWGIRLWMDWAAEREWQQYCEDARQRGVKLTLAEFAPPEIPDEENFAALPMFKIGPTANTLGSFQLPQPTTGPLSKDDPIAGKSIDWSEWAQAFKGAGLISELSGEPIADVLRGLDRFAPQIVEWRQWQQRPRGRFPFDAHTDFNTRYIPYIMLHSATQVFGIRMRAHLAQGDSPAALDDFRDALQSYRALQTEPTAAAGAERMAVIRAVTGRIGGGLAAHAWAEPELRELEAELLTVRIHDDYWLAISSERALALENLDRWLAADTTQRVRLFANPRDMVSIFPFGGPRRPTTWLDTMTAFTFSRHKLRENQLRLSHYVDELLARLREDDREFDLDRATPSAPKSDRKFSEEWHYVLFYVDTAPTFQDLEERYVRTQIGLQHLHLGIALERFHLAHGAFPETLQALMPDFLADAPIDPWSGKPMLYRRHKADSYRLYSVGQNRKDDGGEYNTDWASVGMSQRDVIWPYAPP